MAKGLKAKIREILERDDVMRAREVFRKRVEANVLMQREWKKRQRVPREDVIPIEQRVRITQERLLKVRGNGTFSGPSSSLDATVPKSFKTKEK